ncbi:chorion b-ZIP transcription factor [Danaus plexippus plexippus]|uniref:Chorion b-ZIP transcription factor n=1 Tax=Danaus plexippus plexippus TaxID=278856 RepID=A0A212FN81_DANPL|nr:chorion b-ZIP transcription factor [Danaus plexippus plexippus]
MVAQKITVSPRQGDDNGTKFNSNQRQGFFANESQGSTFSETNRHRSLKVPKEPTGERSARSNPQRKNRIANIYSNANNQLFRVNSSINISYHRFQEFLKTDLLFTNTMFHDMDCEFFQDLVQLTSASAEEGIVQSIDSQKITEKARAYHTDTQHTPFSPQGWDVSDANSPSASTHNQTQSYPVSPTDEGMATGFNTDVFYNSNAINEVNIPFQEQFLDISTLPLTIGDLAPDSVAETNPWQAAEFTWQNTDDLDYTKPTSNIHTMPFIDQEDSLDTKFISVIPREVESNDVVISEYIINETPETKPAAAHNYTVQERRSGGLSLDVARYPHNWQGEVISTPEVLSFVEQLEKEKCTLPSSHTLATDHTAFTENTIIEDSPPAPVDYEPITPKSEPQIDSDEDIKPGPRKRRRNDSEDSDVSYTPYSVSSSPRKYRKRKPSIPIKDMIRALEGAQQQTKARRGRPPKRRESDVSAVSENSSSTHEISYRKLRDKNNEASKRSRMNRKLKELQMEQMAVDLEERNKRLRIRAELLEEATKKLRDAFMLAVSQKKAG